MTDRQSGENGFKVSEQVSVGEIEDFEDSDFANFYDKFQHALILPKELIANQLEIEPYNYVDIKATDLGWDTAITVYLLPFSKDFSPKSKKPTGLLKDSHQKSVFSESKSDKPNIDVRPHETSNFGEGRYFTPVRLPLTDHTPLRTCYINKDDLEQSPFSESQFVEVYNPNNGRRVLLKIGGRDDIQSGTLSLGNIIRDSLGVIATDEGSGDDSGEKLGIRTPVKAKPPEKSLLKRARKKLGKIFVDFNRIHLQVQPGLDIDEERQVVRIGADMRQLLGIEVGDRAVIEWGGKEREVLCLDVPSNLENTGDIPGSREDSSENDDKIEKILKENHSSNDIYVPSTERKHIDVCINDLVSVRRSMHNTMNKTVSVSIIGILGLLIAVRPIFDLVWPAISSSAMSSNAIWLAKLSSLVIVLGIFSISLVYALTYPQRKEVEV